MYVSGSYNLRHVNCDARVVHRHVNYEANIPRHMQAVLFSETSSQCCSQAPETSVAHKHICMNLLLCTGKTTPHEASVVHRHLPYESIVCREDHMAHKASIVHRHMALFTGT